jgi:predicted nucleic acid-binding protein
MTLIVDASVAIKWVVREDQSHLAADLIEMDPIAPDLLRAEFANVLATKVRLGEISAEQALAAQADSEAALTIVPSMGLAPRALEIALELSHPAYDCFYLALAETLDGTLITADTRFLRRCADTRYRDLVRPLE